MVMEKSMTETSSGRLLTDVPCKVCADHSSGKHYGIFACDGCAGFFKRSVRRGRKYECKARDKPETCAVDKIHRNQCRACRLRKCLDAGMNREAVQHERGPRHSTLRRQISLCLKTSSTPPVHHPIGPPITSLSAAVALAACTPPLPPHPSLYRSPSSLPIRPATFSATNGGVFNLLSSDLSPAASSDRLPHALTHYRGEAVAAPLQLSGSNFASEAAARILFMSVRWVKSVPGFRCLADSDQRVLLRNGWRDLFLLTASQLSSTFDLNPGTAADLSHLPDSVSRPSTYTAEAGNAVISSRLWREIHVFYDLMAKFRALNVDATEYACLKGIVLFKTGGSNGEGSISTTVSDTDTISRLQDDAQLALNRYIDATTAHLHVAKHFRFGRLLLLLTSLRSVSADTIEEMYFRSTLGDIRVSDIVADMFASADV